MKMSLFAVGVLIAGLVAGCEQPDNSASPEPTATATPATVQDTLAGRWILRVSASSFPKWVLDVDENGSATLIESSSSNRNYESITLRRTSKGITVTMVEVQSCGNRSFDFILGGEGTSYSGYVFGEKRGCRRNNFRSAPDTAKLTRS